MALISSYQQILLHSSVYFPFLANQLQLWAAVDLVRQLQHYRLQLELAYWHLVEKVVAQYSAPNGPRSALLCKLHLNQSVTSHKQEGMDRHIQLGELLNAKSHDARDQLSNLGHATR